MAWRRHGGAAGAWRAALTHDRQAPRGVSPAVVKKVASYRIPGGFLQKANIQEKTVCLQVTSVGSDCLELLDELRKVFFLVEVEPLVLHSVSEVAVPVRGKAGHKKGASKGHDHCGCAGAYQLLVVLFLLSLDCLLQLPKCA